jgi:hypothetical protein
MEFVRLVHCIDLSVPFACGSDAGRRQADASRSDVVIALVSAKADDRSLAPARVAKYLAGAQLQGQANNPTHSGTRNAENDWISRRRIPSGRTIVHATVAHVHAVDDGITKRRAALNDLPVSIDATRRQFTERWTAAAWTAPAEITRRCYH